MSSPSQIRAARLLIREALEAPPVKANGVVDPSAAVTDPLNSRFVPRTRPELAVALGKLFADVPIDDVPATYRKVEDMVDRVRDESAMKRNDEADAELSAETVEERLRRDIRRLIMTEINPRFDSSFSGTDYGDSGSDDDDDDVEKKPKRAYKSTALGSMADVEGASFDEIAEKLGFAVSGAKQAVDKAIEKMRFLSLMDSDDREIMVLTAMDDYIDMLASSGELTDDDVWLMKQHPDVVRELDGFREFLHKYVKKERKVDAQLNTPRGSASPKLDDED